VAERSSALEDLVLVRGQRRILELIAEGCPLEDVLRMLCATIEEVCVDTHCTILLLEPDGVHVRHAAGPTVSAAYLRAIDGAPIGPQAGSCGTAMYYGRRVVVEDVRVDPLWADYKQVALGNGLSACASVPIVAGPGKEVLGSFAIYHEAPGPFRGQELRLLEAMTDLAAVAIVNHRRERALRQNEEALREMQKAESLAVLAGGVAHDFNNLFTAMVGHLELLGVRIGDDPEAKGRVRSLSTLVAEAASFTHQLLAYAGKASFDVRPRDLNALVSELVQLLSVLVSKKVDFQVDLEPGLPLVDADAAQLKQITLNLVTNAAEAVGDARGSIAVRTRRTYLDPEAIRARFRGQALAAGPYVLLEVEDTGVGMSAEVAARIFEPFFTTKFSGRGLGLAVVRGILKSHGGGFEVSSEPGRGTRFRLYFPAISTAPPRALEPPARPPPPPAPGGAVLLVEDEPFVRSSTREVLEHLGHRVVEATDGEAGLRALEAHGGEVAAVIMDVTMPKLDGCEAAAIIARRWPSIPVLLTSGHADPCVDRSALPRRSAFLGKPYDLDDLERALASLLEPSPEDIEPSGS
jgi:signal transduction histidine kinase/CheY-like chemotaxis protein